MADNYRLVESLSTLLEQRSERGLVADSTPASKFDALYPPAITFMNYVRRILKYTQLDEPCYLVAMCYMFSIVEKHPCLQVTKFNVHRLFIASFIIASKFWSDRFYSNRFMSQVGGLAVTELNELEIEMCILVEWNFHVDPLDFQSLCAQLQKPQYGLGSLTLPLSHELTKSQSCSALTALMAKSDAPSDANCDDSKPKTVFESAGRMVTKGCKCVLHLL